MRSRLRFNEPKRFVVRSTSGESWSISFYRYRLQNVLFGQTCFLIGPILASLFSFFSHYNWNTNWKKHRYFALNPQGSNPKHNIYAFLICNLIGVWKRLNTQKEGEKCPENNFFKSFQWTQDAPFFVFRLLLITYYNLISYMNIFFTCKNTLVITLQVSSVKFWTFRGWSFGLMLLDELLVNQGPRQYMLNQERTIEARQQ